MMMFDYCHALTSISVMFCIFKKQPQRLSRAHDQDTTNFVLRNFTRINQFSFSARSLEYYTNIINLIKIK